MRTIEYATFIINKDTNRIPREGISIMYPEELFKMLPIDIKKSYYDKIIKLKRFSIKNQQYGWAAYFRDTELKIKKLNI